MVPITFHEVKKIKNLKKLHLLCVLLEKTDSCFVALVFSFFFGWRSVRDAGPTRVHSSAVERRIADPEVAGSIPAAPFSFAFFAMHTFRARVPFAEWKAWGIGLVV